MSKTITLYADPKFKVVDTEVSALEKTIVEQFGLIHRGEREYACRALLVGLALHRMKASLKHGEWMPWQKRHLVPISGKTAERTTRYYMRLADEFVGRCSPKLPEFLALPGTQAELVLDSEATAPARRFMAKVEKFVGQMSLMDLFEKYGIRERQKIGGARDTDDDNAEPAATPDADELYQQSRDEIGGIIQRAEMLLITENRLQYLAGHPEEISGVVSGLRSLADKVEAAAKPLLKK